MNQNNMDELRRLLIVSEGANNSFEYLITLLCETCEASSSIGVRRMFDRFALDDLISRLDCCITASAEDDRVIRMCRIFLSFAGIHERECCIDANGEFRRRKVYFAQRADGAVKIGSSMDVRARLSSLRTGAGEDLNLLYETNGSTVAEKTIHEMFKDDRIHGEWFRPQNVLRFIEESKKQTDDALLNSAEAVSLPH